MTIEINGKVTTIAQLNGIINSDTDIDGAVSLGGTIIGASLSERGLKGERGAKGDTGETGNGITDIEYVSSLGNVDTYKITFSDGNETTFEVTNGIDGQDGTDGADGFSPIANVTKAGDTATISITDSNGTTTATVSDGADGNDGADGQDGQDGADGFSPSASVSKSGSIATITITDKNGTTSASVSDGSGVPTGGTSGQILTKHSATDYDVSWEDPSGGSVNDVTVDGTSIVNDGVAELETVTQLRDGLMTATDKQKLDGIASGAEVNVNADWDAASGDAQILNKPTIPSNTSDLTNDSGFTTKNMWYGTCSTGASTAAKVVTTSSGDFTLTTGSMVRVKFTNGNSYNGTATLNVDGKGAKNITRVGTTTTTRYYWVSGEVVDFVYDGTNFVMSGKGTATTTYYGLTKLSSATNSTSETLSATPKAVKTAYDLANSKSDFSGDYDDLTNKPSIPTKVSDLTNDSGFLTAETDPIFTASDAYGIDSTDITNWDNSYDGKVSLDTSAQSGTTDGDLYSAIVALGWENDVIE